MIKWKEIMNDIFESYNELKQLYNAGKKVSIINTGITISSIRSTHLEKIVEKTLLHCKSIISLVEGSRKNHKELDVALAASAARNIIDCTNLYFYLAERKISPEQMNLRFDAMYINQVENETDICKKLDYKMGDYKSTLTMSAINRCKNEIMGMPSFICLSDKEKARVLSGKILFRENNIIGKRIESALYNLFSNSIHSLYIGLGNNSLTNSCLYNTFFSTDILLAFTLYISIIYTANILLDYLNLRKRLYKLLSKDEKMLIKRLKSPEKLLAFVDELRGVYQKDFFDR